MVLHTDTDLSDFFFFLYFIFFGAFCMLTNKLMKMNGFTLYSRGQCCMQPENDQFPLVLLFIGMNSKTRVKVEFRNQN